jgi:hypothetical protein
MPVVPESDRVATLRKWGISEPLIRLSCGEVLHDQFRISCVGPPWYVYHGSLDSPDGPLIAVFWECSDTVTGVRQQIDGLEFIEFGFEWQDTAQRLARTEQGFWATQFNFFLECDAPFSELRAAAATVGFRYLDALIQPCEPTETMGHSPDWYETWLRDQIVEIDRQARGA